MPEESAQHETVFDTTQQQVATVYAKALLGTTEKAGNTEEVLEQLDSLVADLLDKLPKLDAILSSPRISSVAKEKILDEAFAGKMAKELLNFLKVASRHGRLDCLRAINRAARELLNKLRGRVEVHLQMAHEVDGPLLDQIVQKLKATLNKDVDVHSSVNSELIGGMIVRVGDTVYDASVRNRLERMCADTIERTAQTIRNALDRFAVSD